MESALTSLKLNVRNIKSTLISGNKSLRKIRAEEKRLFKRQQVAAKRIQKENFVEGNRIPGFGMAAGAAKKISAPVMGLFDRLKEFAGNVLLGILVNNLPSIIRRVQNFLDKNKWIIETLKTTLKITGDLFMVLIDIVNFFNPQKAKLEAERKELEQKIDSLVGETSSIESEAKAADAAVNDFVGDELREKTPEQVRSDVVTAFKEQKLTEQNFTTTRLAISAAQRGKNDPVKLNVPGVGTLERVKTSGFLGIGAGTKTTATDTFGYDIKPEEFMKRADIGYNVAEGFDTDIVKDLKAAEIPGFSQGGTVRPASSSSGGAFPGESGALKKARASVQTFSTFENNASDQSFIIDSQEENNKRFKVLIDNFKELYAKSGISTAPSSPYKLPSPKHQGPTVQHPQGKGIPGLGRIFGYVGSTGLSTGNHIHIETGDGYAPHDDAGKPIPHSVLDNIIVDGRPLHEYNMTSGAGWREHPVTGEWRKHQGYDYPIRGGAPIQLKGGLKYINFHDAGSGGYGKSIMIQDENGNNYIIGHLSKGPDPASLQPPSGGGVNITPVKQPGYGKGGLDMLTQFFDGEGMTEVLVINSTQPIIVPGPTRYIRR